MHNVPSNIKFELHNKLHAHTHIIDNNSDCETISSIHRASVWGAFTFWPNETYAFTDKHKHICVAFIYVRNQYINAAVTHTLAVQKRTRKKFEHDAEPMLWCRIACSARFNVYKCIYYKLDAIFAFCTIELCEQENVFTRIPLYRAKDTALCRSFTRNLLHFIAVLPLRKWVHVFAACGKKGKPEKNILHRNKANVFFLAFCPFHSSNIKFSHFSRSLSTVLSGNGKLLTVRISQNIFKHLIKQIVFSCFIRFSCSFFFLNLFGRERKKSSTHDLIIKISNLSRFRNEKKWNGDLSSGGEARPVICSSLFCLHIVDVDFNMAIIYGFGCWMQCYTHSV